MLKWIFGIKNPLDFLKFSGFLKEISVFTEMYYPNATRLNPEMATSP